MYNTVGSLLPNYALTEWFRARPNLMLHDDDGRLVTTSMNMVVNGHHWVYEAMFHPNMKHC